MQEAGAFVLPRPLLQTPDITDSRRPVSSKRTRLSHHTSACSLPLTLLPRSGMCCAPGAPAAAAGQGECSVRSIPFFRKTPCLPQPVGSDPCAPFSRKIVVPWFSATTRGEWPRAAWSSVGGGFTVSPASLPIRWAIHGEAFWENGRRVQGTKSLHPNGQSALLRPPTCSCRDSRSPS